ncbi:hypothetical protein L2E82_24462 [Cichorium intybus]|uniref:Uncharacterized protein n=1 Tax=Cichorium intybus TaxID=13427 RepID=A0ACB9E0S6_CICIN|nr:hypothetical protein L2E82_24462 [Cichorium intybus]
MDAKRQVAETRTTEEAKVDVEVDATNASSSCASSSYADIVIVEDASEEDKNGPSSVEISSKSNASSSAVSKNCSKTVASVSTTSYGDALNSKIPNVGKFKLQKFVKEGEVPSGPRPSPITISFT